MPALFRQTLVEFNKQKGKKNKKLTLLFIICMISIQATFAQNNVHINTVDLENKVDSLIMPLVDEGMLCGSILIAIHGNNLFAKGYGLADRENNIPNTPETIFRIGSITKTITAIAIMQLQEKNKLNIYDKLHIYLNDFPSSDKITIYHLLTHTSGIPGYNWLRSDNKPQELEVVINWIKELELKSVPGEKFIYSNSGYSILAYIIEKVSGNKYEDYLKEINSRIRFEKSEEGVIKYTAFFGLFLVTGERIQ